MPTAATAKKAENKSNKSKSKPKPKSTDVTVSAAVDDESSDENATDEDPITSSIQVLISSEESPVKRKKTSPQPNESGDSKLTSGDSGNISRQSRFSSSPVDLDDSNASGASIIVLPDSTLLTDLAVDPEFESVVNELTILGNAQDLRSRIPPLTFSVKGFKHGMLDVQKLILRVLHHVLATDGFTRNPKKIAFEKATTAGAILPGKTLLTPTIANAIARSVFYSDYLTRRTENTKQRIFTSFTEITRRSCWSFLTSDMIDNLKVHPHFL